MLRFDVILNASGQPDNPHLDCLKEWRMARYITLSPPWLKNTDTYGIPLGTIKSALDIAFQNVHLVRSKGAGVQWGFFTPSKKGLQQISDLVSRDKIRPIVHKTFKFSELPLAYECQKDGHVRGKIVIENS
jgi:reticulon-4-interacting protein 1, mitochondrial